MWTPSTCRSKHHQSMSIFIDQFINWHVGFLAPIASSCPPPSSSLLSPPSSILHGHELEVDLHFWFLHVHFHLLRQGWLVKLLLYGSELWNLSMSALVQLEGLHIRPAYHMSKKHKPQKGPSQMWVYPSLSDVLKECETSTITHFIGIIRDAKFWDLVDCSIYKSCQAGEWKRGSVPWQWWWQQKMCLDN